MICSTWTQFRYQFANWKRSAAVACTFDAGPPNGVTRAAGSFVADGYQVGMTLKSNTVAKAWLITVVAAGHLTFHDDSLSTAGDNGVMDLEATFIDPDGVERWSVELLRPSGFGATGSTILGAPRPITHRNPFTVTCNAALDDAVAGVDEYDWYLSQRTDVAAIQGFALSAAPASATPLTASGSVVITPLPNDAAVLSPESIISLFKYVHLYAHRRSDGGIQWLDLYRYMTSKVQY